MQQPVSQTERVLEPPARACRRDGWIVFGACAVVIALSFWLTPDPRGYGTHRQLFLPPCAFQLLTSLPCLFCGMTTGFAHMARGQVMAAAAANLLAPLGFAATMVFWLLGLWGALTGREWRPRLLRRAPNPALVVGALVVLWALNIMIHLALQ